MERYELLQLGIKLGQTAMQSPSELNGFNGNANEDMRALNALSLELFLAEQKRSEGCAFCCYTEYPDATLYPREKSEFYAGRSRQVEVDEFDEDELNDVSFCPNCGRDLTEGESV